MIRGITKLTGKSWEDVYTELSIYGYSFGDWGNSNAVFDAYLRDQGYKRSDAIRGKKVDEVLEVFEELMATLQVINPRLYESVMRKL